MIFEGPEADRLKKEAEINNLQVFKQTEQQQALNKIKNIAGKLSQ